MSLARSLSTARREPLRGAPLSVRPLPRLRVLLGCADGKIARLVRESVGVEGGDLFHADTTEGATRLVREERFDAIVADTGLPNFSRSGFTRTVHNSKLNSKAPLVLLAGIAPAKKQGPATSADVLIMPKFTLPAELPPLLKNLALKLQSDRRKHRRLSFRTNVNCVEGIRRFRARSINLGITGMLLEMTFLSNRRPNCSCFSTSLQGNGPSIPLHVRCGTRQGISWAFRFKTWRIMNSSG